MLLRLLVSCSIQVSTARSSSRPSPDSYKPLPLKHDTPSMSYKELSQMPEQSFAITIQQNVFEICLFQSSIIEVKETQYLHAHPDLPSPILRPLLSAICQDSPCRICLTTTFIFLLPQSLLQHRPSTHRSQERGYGIHRRHSRS